jgi:hypothetical protein
MNVQAVEGGIEHGPHAEMARFCIPLFVREEIQVLLDLRNDLFRGEILEPGSRQQNAKGISV